MRNQSPCRLSSRGGGGGIGGGQFKWAENYLRESKDEDLALFQDMRTRERRNFLHPSNDDIEASLSIKVGGLAGFRSPVALTPPRKGNDLLQTDSEKNDYDWLLTPPGTPLFPSLDKDTALSQVGRSVLQTNSASKLSSFSGSSGRETGSRVSRGSPSARSTNSSSSFSNASSTIRGGHSSPSRRPSSPTPRPATPSRPLARASTTLNRASTRSSPPVLRRMNTSPSVRSSSTERNASAKGRTRGTSVSPKLQAWQQPEFGFSSEPPPNLRTSISDRPATTRNATVNSRHGNNLEARHSYSEAVDISRSRWRNTSSSTSRISSSSNSQDRWSSKGSVISSDDGIEISHPGFIDYNTASPNSTPGDTNIVLRMENGASIRDSLSLKQSVRSTAITGETGFPGATSARKSLEASMRRVDHRRVPQNMFRPLLSSAPTSSFYNSIQLSPVSSVIEPSITASSNASSEQGIQIFPGDDESSDEGEIESKWDHLSSGTACINTRVVNEDIMTQGYIHRVRGNHDYIDQCEQDSVTDSTTSPVHAIRFSRSGVASIKSSEPLERAKQNPNDHKTGDISGPCSQDAGGYSLVIESPTSQFYYRSSDENSIGLDSQQEVCMSTCSQGIEDLGSANIQEDNHPLNCTSTNQWGNISDKLQELPQSFSRPEVQDLGFSTLNSCVSDKENLCTVENEIITDSSRATWDAKQVHSAVYDVKSRGQAVLETISDMNLCSYHVPSLDMEDNNARLDIESQTHLAHTPLEMNEPSLPERQVLDTPKRGFSPNQKRASNTNDSFIEEKCHLTCTPSIGMNEATSPQRGALDVPVKGSSLKESPSLYIQEKVSGCTNDLFLEERSVSVDLSSSFDDGVSSSVEKVPFEHSLTFSPCKSHHVTGTEQWDQWPCDVSENSNERVTSSLRRKEGSTQLDTASEESCEDYIDILELTDHVVTQNVETTGSTNHPKLFFDGSDTAIGSEVISSTVEKDLNSPAVVGNMCEQLESSCDDKLEKWNFDISVAADSDTLSTSTIDKSDASSECMKNAVMHNQDLEFESKLEGDSPEEVVLVEMEVHDEVEHFQSNASIVEDAEVIPEGVDEQKPGEKHKHPTYQLVESQLHENEQEPDIEGDTLQKAGERLERKHAARSFSLEEATNTILFCSSIVHDIVYKATTVASEKEQAATAAMLPNIPLMPFLTKSPLRSAGYKRPLKIKGSKSKEKLKETVCIVQPDEGESNGRSIITMCPPTIDSMKSNGVDGKSSTVDSIKEKSRAKLTPSSNCQCTIM